MNYRRTILTLAFFCLISGTFAAEVDAIKTLESVGTKIPRGSNKKLQGVVELRGEKVRDEHVKLLTEFNSLPFVVIGADAQISPEGLKPLANVKGLQRVMLWGKNASDEHAKTLATIQDLVTVYTERGELTDEGVKSLAKLQKLTFIQFSGSKKITGKTLGEFKNHTNLNAIQLSGTSVTGENLGQWKGLAKLESISANFTPFNDAGAKELAKLTQLKRLELISTAITDAGIADLAKIPGLQELQIAGSKVGDSAIPTLAGMKNLRQLAVSKDQFTKFDELKKALPKCNVRIITPLPQ